VLTGFWSFKYFRVVQLNLELSRRADQNLQELSHFFETATAVSNLTKLGEDLSTLTTKLAELLDVEMCGLFLYQQGLEALIAPAAGAAAGRLDGDAAAGVRSPHRHHRRSDRVVAGRCTCRDRRVRSGLLPHHPHHRRRASRPDDRGGGGGRSERPRQAAYPCLT